MREVEGQEFGFVIPCQHRTPPLSLSPARPPARRRRRRTRLTSAPPPTCSSADTGEDSPWNIFDESLVLISVVMAASNTGFPVSFLRLLRLLRLMKVGNTRGKR